VTWHGREIGRFPAEHLRCELGEVPQFGERFVGWGASQAGEKPSVLGQNAALNVALGLDEGRNGNDQADGLDVAQPFLMRVFFGCGHDGRSCWSFMVW
jgi:hypothetical protein